MKKEAKIYILAGAISKSPLSASGIMGDFFSSGISQKEILLFFPSAGIIYMFKVS